MPLAESVSHEVAGTMSARGSTESRELRQGGSVTRPLAERAHCLLFTLDVVVTWWPPRARSERDEGTGEKGR